MGITRFTIVVAGQPRSLFSIIERGDEVTIGMKSPYIVNRFGIADHPTETPTIEPSEVREHRFSIHPSRESTKGINVIKMTRVLANGRKDFYRHYTKAIKSGDKFALFYTRRCGRLDRPNFVPTGKFKNVTLGTYDPEIFTLIYGIAVAAKGLKFDPDLNNFTSMNILEMDFKNIRIIVLWTFLCMPARPYFFSANNLTIPDAADALMNGETADACRMQFAKQCVDLTAQLYNATKIPDGLGGSIMFSKYGLNTTQVFVSSPSRIMFSARLFEIGEKDRRLSLSPYDLR